MLRAVGRGIDTDAWSWLCAQAGQMLFEPPNVSGWDDTRWLDTATFRARWQMASEICNKAQLGEKAKVSRQADEARRQRRALLADAAVARHPRGARALRPQRDGVGARRLGARDVSAPDRERAAHARRRVPRLHDLVTHNARTCCAEHARAGAGLPGIEPGMPTPAGTGLSRRSFLLRSAGLALSVYGAGKLAGLPVFEEGVASAAGRPGTVLVNVFLDGGADSMSILAPTGDPDYRRLRPNLALPDERQRVRRGRAADLAPERDAARAAARRGQGERAAGGRLRPPRPVALRLAPLLGGRGDRRRAALRLARPPARRHRDRRQPAAGRVDGRQPRAFARDHARAGRGGRRARRRSASGCPARGARRPTSA